MRELREDVHAIGRDLHGPPREDSLRGRIHKLENNDASTRAATAALETARELRRTNWTWWQKTVAFLVGLLVALDPILNLINRF